MKRVAAIMIAAGTALAACDAAEPGQAAGESSGTASSATPDLSDGLITCAMPDYDGKQGITVTERFILLDGQPKRYSDFQNVAFDLCEPGQNDCSLTLDGNVIRMDYLNENGVRSRYDVDLASMTIEARKTRPGEPENIVKYQEGAKCTREPLPEGMTIN